MSARSCSDKKKRPQGTLHPRDVGVGTGNQTAVSSKQKSPRIQSRIEDFVVRNCATSL